MGKRVAFNPTEVPVVVDAEGHSVPGLDRAEVDTTADEVRQAVAAGRLVWVTGAGFDVTGSAKDVLARVGDDPAKAAAAIEAENATESPRTSLLTDLGRIAQAADEKKGER